jgi:hypothetical protein
MWVVVFFLIYEDPIDACIKSRAPQSLSVTVNSSNLLLKLLCFFFIYWDMESHVFWTIDLILWNTKISSLTFFMEWSDFPVASSSTCTFFFFVDLWSRSRFPIYYQHHQFNKEISVRLIYFHINYCFNILNLNDISPFKTNSFSFL